MVANLVAVGAAYQAGVIPISAASLETAISLNGVNPATNVQAFRYGRLWVADKVQVLALLDGSANSGESELGPVVARFGRRQRAAYERLASLVSSVKGEDGARVRVRIADLIEYQSVRYAERFARFVSETSQCAATRGAPEIPSAVSENLYKLMAYKDEYEVARLYLLPDWRRSIAERFDAPQRIWYHLHPPFLRAFGKGRKTAFGGWFVVTFYLLRAMRVLRGSGLDPFGHTSVRQTERELIGWYRGLVMQCLRVVNDENKGIVLELLRLPEMVRGFEAVKMTSVERMHQEEERLLAEMRPSLARSGASVGTG
jgi:indolepyruvate ferredoxin oxidoreductase